MNNYPEERFGVPAKSDITLGYSMGEECKVKSYKPDQDYKGGEMVLSGHGDCIDRLLLSWARFFDKVDVEVLEEKPIFHPWREVFQVKRSYFTNMGHRNTDMKVKVTLRYNEGKGCKVTGRSISEEGLIPMKHYINESSEVE